MIEDIHFPEMLTGHELDEYLSRGWFRMGQTIFTTDIVPLNGDLFPVYWLRIDLKKVKYGKSQKKLILRNKNFAVAINPLRINTEIENLFGVYRSSVDFNPPETVEEYLFLNIERNVYDTHLIEIRDHDKLIAAGVFDKGENSIAGILNFFHPAYKKYSLGKYLMLLKIDHALELQKTWYYPGYIANGYSKFDYKLFPDRHATEIYDKTYGRWLPVTKFMLA